METIMKKYIHPEDFEEIIGPMNKTAIYDAIVFNGLENKAILDNDDVRNVMAKKNKLVKSELKHQRNFSKTAKRLFG